MHAMLWIAGLTLLLLLVLHIAWRCVARWMSTGGSTSDSPLVMLPSLPPIVLPAIVVPPSDSDTDPDPDRSDDTASATGVPVKGPSEQSTVPAQTIDPDEVPLFTPRHALR